MNKVTSATITSPFDSLLRNPAWLRGSGIVLAGSALAAAAAAVSGADRLRRRAA